MEHLESNKKRENFSKRRKFQNNKLDNRDNGRFYTREVACVAGVKRGGKREEKRGVFPLPISSSLTPATQTTREALSGTNLEELR